MMRYQAFALCVHSNQKNLHPSCSSVTKSHKLTYGSDRIRYSKKNGLKKGRNEEIVAIVINKSSLMTATRADSMSNLPLLNKRGFDHFMQTDGFNK